MGLTRRQAVLAGLGTLALGGCTAAGRTGSGIRPTAAWDYPAGPTQRAGFTQVQPVCPDPATHQNHPAGHQNPATVRGINAISRSTWTRTGPISGQVNPMNGVSKITIHHEGWQVVNFSDQRTTADRIARIRNSHVNDRGWGDIGYHYVIDRAGRVWEARPLNYQGAHVSQNNEHNLGILVLGNFEQQSPTNVQLASLFSTTTQLAQTYNVRRAMVRSHKEINPTSCPGRNLQRQMNALRTRVS